MQRGVVKCASPATRFQTERNAHCRDHREVHASPVQYRTLVYRNASTSEAGKISLFGDPSVYQWLCM